MNINSNLNSMIQLEKQLEESTEALARLNTGNNQTSTDQHKQLNQNNVNDDDTKSKDVDLAQEMIKQIQMPIAYSVNANVISVQNSMQQTVLDIKA